VCLSAGHPQRVASSLAQVLELPGVRHLCLLPLATLLENVGGVYAPLLSRGSVLLPYLDAVGLLGSSGLDLARLTGAVDHHQPHSLILVPALLQALVAALGRGWLPVYEGYGLSECASVVSVNTPSDDRPGTAGATT
jgi:long-subunit acyl-CoA synthetase (AMP-forming)